MQETQSPLMSSLPVDQPFRYVGPVGSHGREAGFLFHSSIVASPIPGTPDSQSLRWRLISGSLCVCSFFAPHAGIPSDTRIQFWRTLAASVHRVSQLHSEALCFFLQGTPTFGSPLSSSVIHDRLMHLFCLLCRRSCSLIPWVFGTLLIFLPTVVVLLWTSFSLRLLSQPASLSTRVRIAVPLRLFVAPALFRPHVVLLFCHPATIFVLFSLSVLG